MPLRQSCLWKDSSAKKFHPDWALPLGGIFLLNQKQPIPDDRPQKDSKIDEANIGLVIDIKFPETQAPGMPDDNPAKHIEHNADSRPDCACEGSPLMYT